MKNNLVILTFSFLFLSNIITAQSNVENCRIPLESIGHKFYLAKFDIITPFETYQIIDKDTTRKKDDILEKINAYNTVFFRTLNNEIDNVYESFGDSSISLLHYRDITENTTHRYIIKTVLSKFEIICGGKTSPEYHIYDQKMKISYQSFPNLESLIITLMNTTSYFRNKSQGEITQEKINKFSETSIPKEKTKKEMSKGGKITGQVLLYLALTILGAYFASLL